MKRVMLPITTLSNRVHQAAKIADSCVATLSIALADSDDSELARIAYGAAALLEHSSKELKAISIEMAKADQALQKLVERR